MQWLKTWFLKLSIHRQIQFGVLSVSFCVFMLVLGLLSINSFILINISYTDLITILDDKDTQQIEGVQLYTNLQALIMADLTKDSVQYSRNMIENILRQKDFIYPLIMNNFNYSKYVRRSVPGGYEDCNEKNIRKCVIYHTYGAEFEQQSEHEMMKFIIANAFILINSTLDTKLYQQPEGSLNKQFNYLSNSLQAYFVFPYNELHQNVSVFNDWLKLHTSFATEYHDYYYNSQLSKKIFNSVNPKEFIRLQMESPFNGAIYYNKINPIYKELRSNKFMYFPTVSAKYKPIDYNSFLDKSLNTTTMNAKWLQNTNNFIDMVSVDVDVDLIDSYNFEATNVFKGIRVFVQGVREKYNQSLLITPSTCLYFLRFYNISNGIVNTSLADFANTDFHSILECFPYKNGRDYLDQTFFKSDYDQFYVKRRVKVPAVNNYMDHREMMAIYFKVFKNQSPDLYVMSIANSDYFSLRQHNIYVMKNERFMDKVFNRVYFKFIGVMFMILFLNFIFWYTLLLVIYLLLFRVTTSLTKPINVLCKLVKSIGKEESEEDKEDWNFVCSDDRDIQELFDLCKNLIKGGFNDTNSRLKDKKNESYLLNNAYNNISYVKTNNLIIEEEKIEQSSNVYAESIFNYKKNNTLEKINELPVINKEEKENAVNIEMSKDTGISGREHSSSIVSRKLKQQDILMKSINFTNKTEQAVFGIIEEFQRKEEKDFIMFDLFKNANINTYFD